MATIQTSDAEERELPEELGEENPTEEVGEPVKRGRGRPRKDGSPLPQDVWSFLQSRSDAQWDITSGHLYRGAPFLDRTEGGKNYKYVKRYFGRFDQDVIKSEEGSGFYRIDINEKENKGNHKLVGRYHFEIYDPACPPNVPRGAWMDEPRNEKWAKLMPPEAPKTNGQPAGQSDYVTRKLLDRALEKPEPREDNTTAKVIDAMQQASKQTADFLRPHIVKDEKGTDIAGLIAAIATAFKPPDIAELVTALRPAPVAIPTPPPPDNTALELLRDEIKAARAEAAEARKEAADERKHSHEMMLKMLENKPTAPDPTAVLNNVLSAVSTITEIRGLAGGGKPDWATELIGLGKEIVAPAAQSFMPVLAHFAMQSAAQKAQANQTQPQTVPTTAVPQIAAPANQQPQQPNPAQQPNMNDVPPPLLDLAERTRGALAAGINGAAFAESVEINLGLETYAKILGKQSGKFGEPLTKEAADAQKQELLMMLGAFPQIKAMLDPFAERLPVFLDEFFDYDNPAPDDEAEPEPTPSAKPKKKRVQ